MNPNIADLVSEELDAIRKKLNLVTELLRDYVGDESHPVYRLLFDAGAAVEGAKAEVLGLRRDSDG